jgi:hypothetical protein
MQNRLGILILSMLSACSGGAEPESERSADNGGFDGGGQFVLGLSWEDGVFVQPVWDEGQLRLLVANRRTEAVTLGVFETDWSEDPNSMIADEGPARGAALARSTIPAQSTVAVDGSALLGPQHEMLWISADNERLGVIERPQAPLVTSTLPIVSSETVGYAQLETDFSLLPGPTFEATVTITTPGQLWLEPSTYRPMQVERLSPTEVSSDDATVTSTPNGFRVVLPNDTSQETPARVQLSFAPPQGLLSADAMLVIDAGVLCIQLMGDECVVGTEIVRLLPAP